MMWKILVGAMWYVQICQVLAIRDSACFGTTMPCDFYQMSCSSRSLIQVDRLQYGMQQGRCQSKNYTKCKQEELGCCARNSHDCFEDFNLDHTKAVLDKCSGRSSCGPMQAVQARLTQPHNCSSEFSNYISADYSCVSSNSVLNLGSNVTVTGLEVHVVFNSASNATIYRNHSTNYLCTVEKTGYQSVRLEVVDIRLLKPGVVQSCSSVKISVPDANFSAKCSENRTQQNVVYMRRIILNPPKEDKAMLSIDDMFSLNRGDHPVMIWIKFVAFSPYTVSVTCRDHTFPNVSGEVPTTTIKAFHQDAVEELSSNTISVIIGILIPILFLIAAGILGVFVIRRRHGRLVEKKAVVEFENNARYDELPIGKPNSEVNLPNSIYTDIDESKITSIISTKSREYSRCSDNSVEHLVASHILEETIPSQDGSSSCSNSCDQTLKDKSVTTPLSDKLVSNISSVQYVNTVEECAAATKSSNKVLKVKRLADDYIEFEHGDLYDKPQEPKTVDKTDVFARTTTACGKMSNKNNPVVSVYDYAAPDGGTGFRTADDNFMDDNMYETVDDGVRDDCDNTNDVFTYDYADPGSAPLNCCRIDSISVENRNVSFNQIHENTLHPKDLTICSGVQQGYIVSSTQLYSSSLSPVSDRPSALSLEISASSSANAKNPKPRSANKPITASKPNAADGYENSPNLMTINKNSLSSELTVNDFGLKDKGVESQTNVTRTALSVDSLKLVFEKKEQNNKTNPPHNS